MTSEASSRKPWLAGLFSLWAPGLGQLYNGDIQRAGIVFVSVHLMIALAFVMLISRVVPRVTLVLGIVIIVVALLGPVVDAVRGARRTSGGRALRRYQRWYVYVGVLAISFIVQSTIMDARRAFARSYAVVSGAMEPTLLDGDYVTAARPWSGGVKRNDVVVFNWPNEPGDMLMRVVALPGDTIRMHGGQLYVNDAAEVAREYRQGAPVSNNPSMLWQADYRSASSTTDYSPSIDEWGPLVVPADQTFLLGDNRHASLDSRFRGFVPRENIKYVVRNVYYSKQGFSRMGRAVH